MTTKEDFKEKIEEQLVKWTSTIDGLKVKFDHAEADAKAALHDQLESHNAKRVKAEKILADISVTSQDVWELVKSGAEQGWSEVTRSAKSTMDKVREALAKPKREEEVRLIAYEIWLNEGCPHGRHEEHWFKAESIWQAKNTLFCESQHRALASLRRQALDPEVELYPTVANERGIRPGDWVSIETPEGSVRARAGLNDTLKPNVVCGQHGWWQASTDLGAPGYDPFSPDGANFNLIIGNDSIDPISGSVPHRAYLCQIRRAD